jgi:adenylate cyclase
MAAIGSSCACELNIDYCAACRWAQRVNLCPRIGLEAAVAMEGVQRRLSAIVCADVAGYSRLMGADEEGTLAQLKAHRRELIDPKIAEHSGRIVKTTGDGLLVEFASVMQAVRCSLAVQTSMSERNASVPVDRRVVFRVGINLGDIIVDADDIFGDGVNVAARLQEIAEPGGICISARVHEDVRDRLDAAFADAGEQVLKNIARPVRVWRWSSAAGAGAAPAVTEAGRRELPPLSIVVLPFASLGGDADQAHFADGLTEDLTTDLSRLSGSFVIARNTASTYGGQAVDVRRVGRELGVRYALEGSVRRSGERIRVNVQLADTTSGSQVWADRFDHDRVDLLGLQDAITGRLANALRVELIRSAARDADRRRAGSTEALDLLLRARALRQKPSAIETLNEARGLFERALKLDAGLVDGWAGLAYVLSAMALNFPDSAKGQHLAQAEQAAARALALDPDHADAHFALGRIRMAEGRHADAAAAFETTLSLDRNHASAHTQLGLARMWQGDPASTIPLCYQAMRLSPRDPLLGNWHLFVGIAHALIGEDQAALEALQRAVNNNPGYYMSRAWLAALQWLAGDKDAGRASASIAQQLRPTLSIASINSVASTHNPAILQRLARIDEAWRQLGIPN